ncbi:hypothetical protein HZU67_01292 [Apis mellifera carnica]|uniref:Uncharacterized protein LOC100577450 n=1 Tax=Apis mellifera TaxID=7460 RepID=A0A7M7GZX5_APIME|nr:uncharacterized protein LOC100577450 [Apis mellifera]KAG9438282.1 hypothetical protein HZU67_01292 [Apis mellifera carnica]|eukprot:XP_006571647.1 uncharacterized protein LOC100577450 [Apis mellifera]
MIEKNEENTDNDSHLVRIRLITDKRTFLEKQFLQVQEEIKICFAQLAQTLYAREKQLLRQSEAIYRQQISLALSSQEIPPSIAILNEKNALEEQIKQFGRIELIGSNSTTVTDLEPYKIEEYQDINKDHVYFDKSIKNTGIIPFSTKTKFSCTIKDEKIDDISTELELSNTINLMENSNLIPTFQKNDSEKKIDHSSKMDTELQENNYNLQITNVNEQENAKNYKNSRKNIIEEQHNSHGHTEQVQQWLDQILLETEIEPTIHEVEKLPDISEHYVYTKFHLET